MPSIMSIYAIHAVSHPTDWNHNGISGWEQDGKNICLYEGVADSTLEYEGLHEYYFSAYTIRLSDHREWGGHGM